VLVDTHCHVDSQSFPEGAEAVLDRARSAGVGGFVCVGVGGLNAARGAVELARHRLDVVATVGIHPHDASSWQPALETELRALLDDERVVAVGEVGLDYHYYHSPHEVQDACFRRFVELARELRKPLVIHTRSAAADTLRVLEEENARDVGGIIHCFSEDREFARRALDLDFDLSFSGIVTFKNASQVHDVVRWAPAGRILLETDSPYLSPVPLRGKRCEPAFVVHTARRVAELRSVAFEELCEQTGKNAERRFGARLALARAYLPAQTASE
jgi:TatD DNase family protein